MSRPSLFLSLAGAAALVVFAILLVQLLALRFERGDVYPPSSTLRPDPLGTRALYEALPGTGAYRVARGYVELDRELAQKPATLFILGLQAGELGEFEPDEITQLGQYVWNGGRVVITLAPRHAGSTEESDDSEEARNDRSMKKDKDEAPSKKEVDARNPTPAADAIPEPAGAPRTRQEKTERVEWRKAEEFRRKLEPDRYVPEKFHPSLKARWGFDCELEPAPPRKAGTKPQGGNDKEEDEAPNEKGPAVPSVIEYSSHDDILAVRTGPTPTEERVPWQSPAYFHRLEPAWQIDYRAKDRPVLMERAWGRGTIVIASDSYFVSNEALRDDRAPRLLAWLAGPPGLLLFDETHLGTRARDGIMVLIRRYGLEGFIYGLLVVTSLFLWRQSVPLVPPVAGRGATPAEGVVSGKDSHQGLVNILRRNLAPRDLLPTCAAEWRRSPGSRDRGRVQRMEEVLASPMAADPRELAATYRRLCEINLNRAPSKNHANQP